MEKYYQPQRKRDFTIPIEMYSWQVFQSKKDAVEFLKRLSYNVDEFDIMEYEGDEIEDYVIIDSKGLSII